MLLNYKNMAYHPPTLDPGLPPSFVGFLVDKNIKDIIHWVKIYPPDLPDMTMKAREDMFMNDASMSILVSFHLMLIVLFQLFMSTRISIQFVIIVLI